MAKTDEPDEVLDLVNDQDEVIGTILREDVPDLSENGAGFVRASNGFIMNSKGELWVNTRVLHKKTAPGGLDYTAGEHVHSGESYVQAMVRGFHEEAGMNINEQDLEYIGKIRLDKVALLPYFVCLYIYKSDTPPDYNKEDFTSGQWLTPQALLDKVTAGVPAKTDILPLVAMLIKSNT